MNACILSIGGSDSGAGAGIQADVKTALAHGVHAATALTCVTAQNTVAFGPLQLVDPGILASQITMAFEDFDIRAVKVGMLGSPEAAVCVAKVLRKALADNPQLAIVVDPVLAATVDKAGAKEVVGRAVCRHLLPLATLVTPNLCEARLLAGYCQQILSGATTAENSSASAPEHASDEVIAAWAARTMIAAGARSVLVKGGHGSDPAVSQDLLFATAEDLALSVGSGLMEGDGECVPGVRFFVGPGSRDAFLSRPVGYSAPRLEGEFHGTGCVLSTAIACNLAVGMELPRAVGEAHGHLHKALVSSSKLGRGSNVINPLV